MRLPKVRRLSSGQILISTLVSLALFAILARALFTLVTSSYQITSYNRARATARELAQEKLETIRNMPYDQVGTAGGIPSGPLLQSENVLMNGLKYVVKTGIVYIDDPFDNLAPTDILPTDYKRVRVDVSWEGLASSRANPITLITDISPISIESTAGGGTLSVIVYDSTPKAVSQADVTIVATATTPQINLSLKTDINGRVMLPGAPVCITPCYRVTVTKTGYSTERTHSSSEVANPDKSDMKVLLGELNEMSFTIDKTSTANVYSTKDKDSNFEPLPNISFSLRGEKTIGTDNDDQPVYKYENTFTTDGSGHLIIPSLEWDKYHLTLNPGVGDLSASNPLPPINILPNTNIDFKFALSSHTANSVLVSFTDPAKVPIASVSARLFDDAGFEATSSSGIEGSSDFGEIFFRELAKKIYHLTATASGYLDFNGNLDVAGYKQETVIMNPE